MKILKDCLLEGGILNRIFINAQNKEPYKILDVKERYKKLNISDCAVANFLYLDVQYVNKKYEEGKFDERSLTLGLCDLEAS